MYYDLAVKRVMLIGKTYDPDVDGRYTYQRISFDRVTLPYIGECFEPVDWTGNLSLYNTDKVYTGVEFLEGSLSSAFGFPHTGYVGLPTAS